MKLRKTLLPLIVAVVGLLPLLAATAHAAGVELPGIRFNLDGPEGPKQVSSVLEIIFMMTVISLAPSILVMTTSFTRIVVSIGFLRQAMGTQQSPSNQIVVALALFLTFYIMQPVWERIQTEAIVPYQANELTGDEFLQKVSIPMKDFMLKQTRKSDLSFFVSLSKQARPNSPDELSFFTVLPAFMVSEIKTAFQIGFLLYIPFIILDMVIASVLLSMGMMMLPPVLISLPFKLMLFVLVDGWGLLIGSLVKSFQ